jgi:hypothetical protein
MKPGCRAQSQQNVCVLPQYWLLCAHRLWNWLKSLKDPGAITSSLPSLEARLAAQVIDRAYRYPAGNWKQRGPELTLRGFN